LKPPDSYFFNDPELSEEATLALAQGDEMPALFEWYQDVGLTVHYVASISRESPGFRLKDGLAWTVLRALLHRCARLMLANVALTHEGLFGDAAKVLDRCIFEGATKARWLAKTGAFDRYLASSLKPELALKARLERDIIRQGAPASPRQERMLGSVERHRALAGPSWEEVAASKKLPPLDAMISDLGDDPLSYLVGQQLGSHAVHGSWPSLLTDYLREEDGTFELRDHDVAPHAAQYAGTIIHVLTAAIDVVVAALDASNAQVPASGLEAKRERFWMFYASTAG
jgi:hypothetical protein